MVNVNPGLDEIKYNITGGSIHAQGKPLRLEPHLIFD